MSCRADVLLCSAKGAEMTCSTIFAIPCSTFSFFIIVFASGTKSLHDFSICCIGAVHTFCAKGCWLCVNADSSRTVISIRTWHAHGLHSSGHGSRITFSGDFTCLRAVMASRTRVALFCTEHRVHTHSTGFTISLACLILVFTWMAHLRCFVRSWAFVTDGAGLAD